MVPRNINIGINRTDGENQARKRTCCQCPTVTVKFTSELGRSTLHVISVRRLVYIIWADATICAAAVIHGPQCNTRVQCIPHAMYLVIFNSTAVSLTLTPN